VAGHWDGSLHLLLPCSRSFAYPAEDGIPFLIDTCTAVCGEHSTFFFFSGTREG
jgi:hypothetical protein